MGFIANKAFGRRNFRAFRGREHSSDGRRPRVPPPLPPMFAFRGREISLSLSTPRAHARPPIAFRWVIKYTNIRRRATIYTNIHQYARICAIVRRRTPFTPINTNMRQYTTIYNNIRICQYALIYPNVRRCAPTCIVIRQYTPLRANIKVGKKPSPGCPLPHGLAT
jgi:hypothetical protein